MHLSQAQSDFMDELQRHAIYEGSVAYLSIMAVPQLLFLYAHVRETIGDDLSQGLVVALLGMNLATFRTAVNNFQFCERLDYFLHDIPPEEEAEVSIVPSQNIRFSSWSDQECSFFAISTNAELFLTALKCLTILVIKGFNL